MVCTTLEENYKNYKDSIANRSVKTKKNFSSLVGETKQMYQKIFNYSAYSINDDSSKLMIFTKDKEPLKIDDWEISFSIDFKQRDNLPNEFELHKYSYVMKNSEHYFRFEGTDEGEEACHPYYHLHIKEDGHPRIATHIFTPYDFLIFIADMSQKCERLK